MNYSDQDNRGYIRVGKSLRVSYTVVDTAGKKFKAVTKDISGKGMKLPLREKLEAGTELALELELLSEKKRIPVQARIIWVKANQKNKIFPYEAGIEFVNLDPAKRTKLSNIIQYLNRANLPKELF